MPDAGWFGESIAEAGAVIGSAVDDLDVLDPMAGFGADESNDHAVPLRFEIRRRSPGSVHLAAWDGVDSVGGDPFVEEVGPCRDFDHVAIDRGLDGGGIGEVAGPAEIDGDRVGEKVRRFGGPSPPAVRALSPWCSSPQGAVRGSTSASR